MAEKSTILSKKLISLNKTFNTFPSTKSKESKQQKKLEESSTSLKSSTELECTLDNNNKKSSIFSNRFNNEKSIDKKVDKTSELDKSKESTGGESSKSSESKELNKSLSLESDNSKSEKSNVNKSIKPTESIESTKSTKSAKQIKPEKSTESTKSEKPIKSTNKYTSFFTSSITTSTTKSPAISTSAKPTTTTKLLSTINSVSTNSSANNSPIKSTTSTTRTSTKPTKQSLPKFKFNKKKTTICNEQPQWHADNQLSTNNSNNKPNSILNNKQCKLKEKSSSLKSSSQAFRSKTAKTLTNTFVKPIKRSSIKFENKRLLFTSSIKQPKIVEDLSSNDDFTLDRNILDEQTGQETNVGLKVSFDEEMKLDRHRSNSDNSARLNKKQNLISSLRRSIFANQELNQTSCPAGDRSLSLTNKSLSNRMMGMMGMINKGKSHLQIVRSHSLESNKFSSKRVIIIHF